MMRTVRLLVVLLALPALVWGQAQIVNGNRIHAGWTNYGTTGGTATAYTLTFTPALPGYVGGQCFLLKPHLTNTGPATLNVQGKGALTIKKLSGSTLVPLLAGDLLLNRLYHVCHDGTDLQLIGTAPDASSTGVSDGDKGDLSVSVSGTVWTIDPGAVTYSKLQPASAASRLLARGSAGPGDWQEVTLGANLAMTGTTLNASGAAGVPDADKGDITVTGTGTIWTIDNTVVTYAKIQNVSATARLLGRNTAGAGPIEELTPAAVKSMLGITFGDIGGTTTAAQLPNASADGVTKGAVAFPATDMTCTTGICTLAANAISPARLADNAVTLPKLADLATARLLGRATAGTGDPEALTTAQVKSMLGITFGDISGDLPYASLTPPSAASRLLARGDTPGDWQEVTLGTNLAMSGTTLNATGGLGDIPTATSLVNSHYVGDGTLGLCTWSEGGMVIEAACDVDKTTLFTSDILMFDGPMQLRNVDGDSCATINNLTGLTTYHTTNACQRPSVSRPFDAMAFNVGAGVTVESVSLNGWPATPVLDGPNSDAGTFTLVVPVLWRDFAAAGQVTLQLACHSLAMQTGLTLIVRVGAAVCTGSNTALPGFVAPTTGQQLTCTFDARNHDVQMSNIVTLTTTGCQAGQRMDIPFASEGDMTAGWSTTTGVITGGLLTYETVGTP